MTRLMMTFRWLAVMLAVILVFSSVASAADIKIPACNCGPISALNKAGKDKNLLPSLKKDNGSPLEPKDYRSYKGGFYLLADDAQPDAAKTAANIAAEVKLFGAAPKSSCSGPSLKEQLDAANLKINELTQTVDTQKKELSAAAAREKKLNDNLKLTEGKLEESRQLLKAAKAESDSKFGWGWLLGLTLLALIIAFLASTLFVSRNYISPYAHRTAVAQAASAASAEVTGLQTRITALEAENTRLGNSYDSLSFKWNDLEAVRERFEELEIERRERGGNAV